MLGIETHLPQRHTMFFRRKAETSQGGEIQGTGVSGDFPDHEDEIATAQTFFQREQRIFGRRGRNMDQAMADLCRQARKIGAARKS